METRKNSIYESMIYFLGGVSVLCYKFSKVKRALLLGVETWKMDESDEKH